MIFLVHEKAHKVVNVWRDADKLFLSGDLCSIFWKLAVDYPEDLLIWIEKDFLPFLRKDRLEEIFDHELKMSSYAIRSKFLSGKIGYVDQLPFINIKANVKFPTWRMSSDVGGIHCKNLLNFGGQFRNIANFDYLLNSIAKVGQSSGLFCYSEPQLVSAVREKPLRSTAGNKQLFSFVYQNYRSVWIFVLFYCCVKYERSFPLVALLQLLKKRKFDSVKIPEPETSSIRDFQADQIEPSVDVIIPTLGRAEYVRQVVEDFRNQSLLPKTIILVEQQPIEGSMSELQDLLNKKWPFQILHILTRKTGACRARNLALEKVKSQWVFFADDDIRLKEDVLSEALRQAKGLKASCINLNCKQPGEVTVFPKIKQWGSFGSGTSIVESIFVRNLRFSEVFEHGYGEDLDFGMKLREMGCDIIYHPKLEIEHLKAPTGGFRKNKVLPWEKGETIPKPSPTVMILAKKYFTDRQIKGFKISLFLKFFRNQRIRNPFVYFRMMQKNWKCSEEWAERLEKKMVVHEIDAEGGMEHL